jgi:hypothetical protein
MTSGLTKEKAAVLRDQNIHALLELKLLEAMFGLDTPQYLTQAIAGAFSEIYNLNQIAGPEPTENIDTEDLLDKIARIYSQRNDRRVRELAYSTTRVHEDPEMRMVNHQLLKLMATRALYGSFAFTILNLR